MGGELVPAADVVTARVDRARAELLLARDATDAKRVADMARAAEVYARRQRLAEDAIAYATAIKIDAMTLMGEFLKAAEKNTGAKGIGTSAVPEENRTPTLADVGITKKESSNAQALAAIKEKAPEVHEQIRAGKTTVAKARVESRRQEKREELKAKADAAPGAADSWRIVTGDCVEELAKVEPGTVRLAFADPPYNQGVDYGGGAKADRLPDHQFLAWCGAWMDAVVRTLTPDGSFWVLISDEYADDFARLLRLAGLRRKQWLVWYESFGVCDSDRRGFARSSRHLLWYVRDSRNFVFNPDPVTRPSWRQRNGDARADPGGRTWDSVWGIDPPIPRLVGTAAERIPDFPTQLPLALLRPIVGCASDPGDLVLDPFNGSGTTGAACIELGRRYLGIERSGKFAEMARLRLKGVRRETA